MVQVWYQLRDIRCEHGRSAQEAIRMGCKTPPSAIKEQEGAKVASGHWSWPGLYGLAQPSRCNAAPGNQ
eukprot:1154883-Pelagomonas_calceolata.AAC.2